MTPKALHPYRTPAETAAIIDRIQKAASPLVHPQLVLQGLRREQSSFNRANGWLADHIVGLAGTMLFFYFLCILIGVWSFWQGIFEHDKGFDPFPFAFLFFILGGIMQSLFVPTMLTASNRATLRDRIKDEADHRAWTHLYEVNDEQLTILRQLAQRPLADTGATKPGDRGTE